MALSTYAELKSSIASWIVRDGDTAVVAAIPDFITLFEARINRTLRVRQMETTATLVPSDGLASLPSDFLEWRSLTHMGTLYTDVQYVVPAALSELYPDNASDTPPRHFTISGSSVILRPIDSENTDLRLYYYAKIAALSDSNTSNWLLEAYPDLYLAGALVEANAFVLEPDAAAMWKVRSDEIIQEIKRLDYYSRAPSAMVSIGVPTP